MKPCALYHRVSTADQDSELARDELREAAARLGYEVALEVEETGSGAQNDRPGLVRVLEAASRGKVCALLVWKLDRFGRSALDLLGNIRLLEREGVRFVAITQGIDIQPGGDPMSRLLVTMLAAIAEFERALISERSKLGIAKARAEGKRLGRPPLEGVDHGKIALLRAQERSWRAIAKEVGVSYSTVRRSVLGLSRKRQGHVDNLATKISQPTPRVIERTRERPKRRAAPEIGATPARSAPKVKRPSKGAQLTWC